MNAARVKFDAEARRVRKLLARARALAMRPPPAADGRLPDFDDPANLIPTAEVRRSLAFAAGLAEATANPMRRNP